MSHDWLFDGGPPEEEGDRALVAALAAHRYSGPPPAWPVAPRGRWWAAVGLSLAAAAAVFLGVRVATTPPSGWGYRAVEGPGCAACVLSVGDTLRTGASTRVRLDVADVGLLDVAPGTTLSLAASGDGAHRVVLERGRVDALIVAPARAFVVSTPHGDVVDLGCAFALAVDARGAAQVDVGSGMVAVEREGRSARVPAGARGGTRPDAPPATPRWQDADPGFAAALDAWDAGAGPLAEVLAAATPRDTLSLWHLATEPGVFERIVALEPGVLPTDEAAVRRGDPAALELLWRDLAASWR